jgi:hypothetical protein
VEDAPELATQLKNAPLTDPYDVLTAIHKDIPPIIAEYIILYGVKDRVGNRVWNSRV